MSGKGTTNRDTILNTANRLFYERGYNQTSFSDIAERASIPKGNFYYYFKTKDDIFEGVVEQRMARIEQGLKEWSDVMPTPVARLKRFIQMLRNEAKDMSRYGCPLGTLNLELGKAQPRLKTRARDMFDMYRQWIVAQFEAMAIKEADNMAMHFLGRAQGIAVLAYIYNDKAFIARETDELDAWLDGLAM
ncbi:MAG: TetR/AcrR family transcriptional regulator [Gammaproteobacteria bacterium]|nr:MAG: TetR/AcrR family transcriptional regulator [Gammaproteobacteria bacterium]